MLSCSTQLALAAGTATVAAGVVWYLDCRLAVWRLSALASLPRMPVEKMVAPQHAAAPATEPEGSLSLLSRLSACDADVDDPETPDTACVSPGAAPGHTPLVPAEPARHGASAECCTHLLALPDELLVLVLASLPATRWVKTWVSSTPAPISGGRTRRPKEVWQMKEVSPRQSSWSALDRAGPCCKAFAESVPKAATVIAGQATTAGTYPWSAGLRVRYLSKLEQDTMLRLH